MISDVVNHLWQSTAFAAAAALLTIALRKNRAGVRYWIWMAASLKFLFPFALLVGIGGRVTVHVRSVPAIASTPILLAIEQAGQPFVLPAPNASNPLPTIILMGWACGFLAVIACWTRQWRRVRVSPLLEPGVFGIFRPVLRLPDGIAQRLSPAQLQAIVAHELCHIRRRDNLFAAIHMLVAAIFWFHPLVWWIGARLLDERERACDEEVLRQGNAPDTYAESILAACRLFLESPLPCVSGVTGSDLKKRIEAIMTNRLSPGLTLGRKLLLSMAGAAAIAGPILIGALYGRAQSQPAALTFEVASVKAANPEARGVNLNFTLGGGVKILNSTLKAMITMAYDIQNFQLSGGPAWLDSDRFDVIGKGPMESGEARQPTAEQMKQARERLRSILAERFRLRIHRDTKEAPVYALVIAKNGPKLKESHEGFGINGMPGQLIGAKAGMALLARVLSGILRRPVVDHTGLDATYAFKLEWTPDFGSSLDKPGAAAVEKAEAVGASLPDSEGPSIFSALQEQLGLRLESQKGPVETIVIDRAEKPSEN